MELSVLTTLEFNKIRDMLAERTGSIMGRELAESLEPVSDANEVSTRLAETAEAREVMNTVPTVPLGGIRDIRASIKRGALGAILEPHELLAVSSTLYAGRRMKSFLSDLPVETTLLTALSGQINILRNIETTIEATVTEQGVIRDDASSELLKPPGNQTGPKPGKGETGQYFAFRRTAKVLSGCFGHHARRPLCNPD